MKIGVYLSEDKKNKINWYKFIEYVQNLDPNIHFIDLNDNNCNDTYDLVISKMDEIYLENKQNLNIISNQFANININSLDTQINICNREFMINKFKCINDIDNIFIPNNIVINNNEEINNCNIKFPVICKPVNSFASINAHSMAIVFDKNSFSKVNLIGKTLVQEFMNHGGIIYKVYVIGNYYEIIPKKSIDDVNSYNNNDNNDNNYYYFNTPDIKSGEFNMSNTVDIEKYVDINRLNKILSTEFKVDIFGYDLINVNNKFALLDINYFPGYGSCNRFFENLFNYINNKK